MGEFLCYDFNLIKLDKHFKKVLPLYSPNSNNISLQEEKAKIDVLEKLLKGIENEATTCGKLEWQIQQLVLERDTLKEEIKYLYKLKNFDEMQKIMYSN